MYSKAYKNIIVLKIITLSLIVTSKVKAKDFFGPVHGCTFYKELSSAFWGCANPRVKKRNCTIRRCAGPVCTKYKGDRGYMHRPVFLIEVTTRYGKSIFADAYKPTLGEHMKAAKRWYKSRNFSYASRFTDGGGIDSVGGSIFWHARVLPVPFATAAFAYSDLPPLSKASSAIPSCFYGVSEFVTDQWNLGLSDLPFAAAWAPLGIRQCMGTATSIAASEINNAIGDGKKEALKALGNLPDMPGGESFGLGCAYGVPTNLLLAQNLNPRSDAMNYRKLCMGQLGGLLPRQGLINNANPFRSAIMAAWKFASLTKDAFFDSVGGIKESDKWQIVYPKVIQKQCANPKRIATDWTIPGPFEMRNKLTEKGLTYVFAIWRESRTGNCYEPNTAKILWRDVVKGPNYEAIKGVCKL